MIIFCCHANRSTLQHFYKLTSSPDIFVRETRGATIANKYTWTAATKRMLNCSWAGNRQTKPGPATAHQRHGHGATRSPRAQTGALLLLPPSNCNRSLLFSSWPFDFERVNISDAECWETRWQPRTRHNTYSVSVVNTCSRWLMWLCTRKRA